MAGFEPTNARVKVWCLTAWRHPNVYCEAPAIGHTRHYSTVFCVWQPPVLGIFRLVSAKTAVSVIPENESLPLGEGGAAQAVTDEGIPIFDGDCHASVRTGSQ